MRRATKTALGEEEGWIMQSVVNVGVSRNHEDGKARGVLGGERGKENENMEKAVRGLFPGKVALCASGPLSSTRGAANAVVRYAGSGMVGWSLDCIQRCLRSKVGEDTYRTCP